MVLEAEPRSLSLRDALLVFISMYGDKIPHGSSSEAKKPVLGTNLKDFKLCFQNFCQDMGLHVYQETKKNNGVGIVFDDRQQWLRIPELLSVLECVLGDGVEYLSTKRNSVLGNLLLRPSSLRHAGSYKEIRSEDVMVKLPSRRVTTVVPLKTIERKESVIESGLFNSVIGDALGEGTYGSVFRCNVVGSDNGSTAACALKLFKGNRNVSGTTSCEREASIMLEVSGLREFVELKGGSPIEKGRKMRFLIYPFYKNGDLRAFLEAGQNLSKRISLSKDVIKCGIALQRAGIIHGDIRTDNFLVADDGRAILGDFGMATKAKINTNMLCIAVT